MIIVIYCNQFIFQLNTCPTPHQSTRTECTEVQMLFIIMMTVLILTMIVMIVIIFMVADDEHIQPLSQKCKLAD